MRFGCVYGFLVLSFLEEIMSRDDAPFLEPEKPVAPNYCLAECCEICKHSELKCSGNNFELYCRKHVFAIFPRFKCKDYE